MTQAKKIEIFSAGCPLCDEAVATVRQLAGEGAAIAVVNLREPAARERARALGVRAVPAVAVDGALADCCAGRGIDPAALRAAGVGER